MNPDQATALIRLGATEAEKTDALITVSEMRYEYTPQIWCDNHWVYVKSYGELALYAGSARWFIMEESAEDVLEKYRNVERKRVLRRLTSRPEVCEDGEM